MNTPVATDQLSATMAPSILAYKILCSGYIPRPFDPSSRFRILGLHALATVSVIRRHLNKGFKLIGIERAGRGFRLDLLFESQTNKIRLVEVKSARILREIHLVQGALYYRPDSGVDEIAVSNRQADQVLTSQYILDVAEKAEKVMNLLRNNPVTAATSYTPNSECRYCSNSKCPWLPLANSLNTRTPRQDESSAK